MTPPENMSDGRVTVAIPFYGDVGLLRKCVESVLSQTYGNLQVFVIGDGQTPEGIPNDPRVYSYTLPENKGPYYARAVALEATDTEWHAVLDADDWVDSNWLESLLATEGDAVQHSTLVQEYDTYSKNQVYKNARRPSHTKLFHYAPHVGLYRTSTLRKAGGYSPNYRMGYDSFMSSILRLQTEVAVVDDLTYHRRVRSSSLSYSRETGVGTPLRMSVREVLDAAYRKAYRVRGSASKVRKIISELTPDEMWAEVREHAKKVKP